MNFTNPTKRIIACVVAGLLMAISLTSVDAQRIRIFSHKKDAVKLDWLLEEESLWTKTADDLEKTLGSVNFVWQEQEPDLCHIDEDRADQQHYEERQHNATDLPERRIPLDHGEVEIGCEPGTLPAELLSGIALEEIYDRHNLPTKQWQVVIDPIGRSRCP